MPLDYLAEAYTRKLMRAAGFSQPCKLQPY